MIFEEKYAACYVLLTDQISLFGYLYFEILGNIIIIIVCLLYSDVIDLEMEPYLLNQAVLFYMTKKSRQKFKYLEKNKSFWDEIKRIFHNF